ncbi:MAG: methyltransferase domain-containing protein [Deltaproteobacteria bacterium]|nr:methyltransferase domain-containing protein [Deltaproteobacteria bacterium]
MRELRRRYYDLFSRLYDPFIALHSGDRGGALRDCLAHKVGLKKGDVALDICTGTGSLLLSLCRYVGEEGLVIGVDFSRGMLRVAREKTGGFPNVLLVEADVSCLPFKREVFDRVTCSHAFYELKGNATGRCLQEVHRVLKRNKGFFMMEHDIPSNPLVRLLFYGRILSMGSKKALEILRGKEGIFRKYFPKVNEMKTETGRSKIIICQKG